MPDLFSATLAELVRSINVLADYHRPDDEHDQAAQAIYDYSWLLGRCVGRGMSELQRKTLEEAIQITSKRLEQGSHLLDSIYDQLSDSLERNWTVTELRHMLKWWEPTCVGWSSGYFLRQLYDETGALHDWNCFLTPDESDDMLRWHGEEDGCLTDEQIPDGIPPTHWWWWYPREPPPNGSLGCASDRRS